MGARARFLVWPGKGYGEETLVFCEVAIRLDGVLRVGVLKMSKKNPTVDTVHGSRQDLRTIVNLKTQDQSPDLGKAINVYKPQDVKNPFLEQSKQPQRPAQPPATQSTEQKEK